MEFQFHKNRESTELASLLSLLEGLSLSYSICDIRVWSIHSSGIFSCKSFYVKLIDKSGVPLFPFHKTIWIAFVPFKVNLFMWSFVRGSIIMTNGNFQNTRPNYFLCPQWCIMYRRYEESMNHLFLHCPVALNLWRGLFCLSGSLWMASDACTHMLLADFRGFGGNKKAKTSWHCVVYAIFWIIWLERNLWIFEDGVAEVDSLREKAYHLASFWENVSPPL